MQPIFLHMQDDLDESEESEEAGLSLNQTAAVVAEAEKRQDAHQAKQASQGKARKKKAADNTKKAELESACKDLQDAVHGLAEKLRADVRLVEADEVEKLVALVLDVAVENKLGVETPEAENATNDGLQEADADVARDAHRKEEGRNLAHSDNGISQEELCEIQVKYFLQYGLDDRNTIDSIEELMQLCMNLAIKLNLKVDVANLEALVREQEESISDGGWIFDEFKEWFDKTFELH